MTRGGGAPRIGLQLYSVRDHITDRASMQAVLEQVAQMGYKGVEFCGYGGFEAPALRALLDRLGLAAVNTHIELDDWLGDSGPALDYAAALGLRYATLPWIAPERRSAAAYETLCARIPALVEACEGRGLTFCYHNHDFEYVPFRGGVLLDHLLAHEAVAAELDTFWCFFAGRDPCAELRRLAPRVPMLHIKDYTALQPLRFCAAGTGEMALRPILREAAAQGIGWVIVEQDNSEIDTLRSAQVSCANLREMLEPKPGGEGGG